MECGCDCQGYLDERCSKGRGMCGRESVEVCPYCCGERSVGTGRMTGGGIGDPPFEITETCTECNGSGYVWADPDAPENDPMRHVEFPFAENH